MKPQDLLKKDKTKMTGKLNDLKLNVKPEGKIVAIARHGSTNSNGDNVFRGWAETPDNQLTLKGVGDAMKLGDSIKKMVGEGNPDDHVIVSSDLNRATDTAKTASKVSGVPLGKTYQALRSQDTGDFTGQKEDDVKKQITTLIKNHPDKPLPGASESHNDFTKRAKDALAPGGMIEKDHPHKKIIVITHHQVEVGHKNGFTPSTDEMFAKGLKPGELRKTN